MIQRVYAIFDDKAAHFLPPFTMATDGMAVRVFSDCVKDPAHEFGKNPSDYALHRLGAFDNATGTLENGGEQILATGAAIKENINV